MTPPPRSDGDCCPVPHQCSPQEPRRCSGGDEAASPILVGSDVTESGNLGLVAPGAGQEEGREGAPSLLSSFSVSLLLPLYPRVFEKLSLLSLFS